MKKDRNGNRMRAAMVALVLGAGGLIACESQEAANLDQAGVSEDSVTIALTTVPASTLCIRVTATPSAGAVTVKSFIVTPGATSANLQMGVLLPGSYNLAADAFNVACTSISGAGNWVADPVTITVSAGVPTKISMTFRKNAPVVVSADFASNVKSVSPGFYSSYIVTDTGVLQAGMINYYNTFKRANFAAFDSSSVPGNAVLSIAATELGACAVRVDGTIWCWGENNAGELGSGIALGTKSATPVQVAGISNATLIAAGKTHVCAYGLYAGNGGVHCWGGNDKGQLGNGTNTNSATPVYASGFRSQLVAAGYKSSYSINASGSIEAWGDNDYGQLGDGTSTSRTSPVFVSGVTAAFESVTAGMTHACARATNDDVFCWGDNTFHQLGDGTTTSRQLPTRIPGLSAKQVVAGLVHACAVTTGGDALCWGKNYSGALGLRTRTVSSPAEIVSLPSPESIVSFASQNADGTCAISNVGSLYCWGFNEFGNLGNGTNNNAYAPVRAQLE